MSKPTHILVTGVAGTGKSTLAETLKQKNIPCIDGDYDEGIAYWKHKKTGKKVTDIHSIYGISVRFYEWLWDIEKMREFLGNSPEPIIVCGTADNKSEAYPLFERIVFLTAGEETLNFRLKTRQNNSFGKLASHRKTAIKDNAESVSHATENGFEIIDTSKLSPEQLVEYVTDGKGCSNDNC